MSDGTCCWNDLLSNSDGYEVYEYQGQKKCCDTNVLKSKVLPNQDGQDVCCPIDKQEDDMCCEVKDRDGECCGLEDYAASEDMCCKSDDNVIRSIYTLNGATRCCEGEVFTASDGQEHCCNTYLKPIPGEVYTDGSGNQQCCYGGVYLNGDAYECCNTGNFSDGLCCPKDASVKTDGDGNRCCSGDYSWFFGVGYVCCNSESSNYDKCHDVTTDPMYEQCAQYCQSRSQR
jgi:hypothetical protein